MRAAPRAAAPGAAATKALRRKTSLQQKNKKLLFVMASKAAKNMARPTLQVIVIRARDLRAADGLGRMKTSDPYVQLTIPGIKLKRVRTKARFIFSSANFRSKAA